MVLHTDIALTHERALAPTPVLEGPRVAVDTSVPVPELVARVAASHPDVAALGDGIRTVTYRELVEQADRIAGWLLDHGLERGDRVGVLGDRGIDPVIGQLGALRAGGAYVPMDPAYPAERSAFMLADSGARFLLTDTTERGVQTWTGPTLHIGGAPVSSGAALPVAVGPRDLAYVVYTSGSTGTPKGVMVEHGGLCNLTQWHARTFDVGVGTRTALAASPAFDPTVQELWPMLTSGATIFVVDDRTRLMPSRLAAWLRTHDIEHIILPTPLGELLLSSGHLDDTSLTLLSVGGDRLRSRPTPGMSFRFINFYGPAETTVMATFDEVLPADANAPLPAIGTPIDNLFAAVLDPETLEPVPHGDIGELVMGGIGIARGYIGSPELTAEKFVTLDLGRGRSRWYRTGDLVRLRPDGRLEFAGRTDHQVKVRGFRIESGEVEAHLRRHPEVRDAVVIGYDSEAGKDLGAVVVARDPIGPPRARALRRFLRDSLPHQMIPNRIHFLERLPLTANGKVDRDRISLEEFSDIGPRP